MTKMLSVTLQPRLGRPWSEPAVYMRHNQLYFNEKLRRKVSRNAINENKYVCLSFDIFINNDWKLKKVFAG